MARRRTMASWRLADDRMSIRAGENCGRGCAAGEGRNARGCWPAPELLDASSFNRRKTIMAVKVMIPTPLRPYAGKSDTVEVEARDRGRSAGRAHLEIRRTEKASLHRRRTNPQLRQRVSQRRRHSLFAEGKNADQGWRYHQHRAVDRRRPQSSLQESLRDNEAWLHQQK